jgi:hypothetical protein
MNLSLSHKEREKEIDIKKEGGRKMINNGICYEIKYFVYRKDV